MSKKKPVSFVPFANEADVIGIGDLTLENRLDRITIAGDVDLTADVPGLPPARPAGRDRCRTGSARIGWRIARAIAAA
jgi:hypothetical protein